YAPTSINFGEVAHGVQIGPKYVTVTNNGGGNLNIKPDDLTLFGDNYQEFSYTLSEVNLGPGQSTNIPIYVTATTVGPISATLRITYNGNNYDVALSATGLPAGIVVIGTGTEDLSLPIEPAYGYSYSQSIFLQSDIHIANRYIDKISFYWYADDDATSSNNWTIYMANTDLTEFADENSWVTEGLTQVFSGQVDLSAGERWIEITLDTPFYHNNQNLIIAVDENTAGYDYDYYYDYYFYCTSTAAKGYRSIIYYNDSTNPDPANPPTNTFYNDAITGFPNLKLQFQEEQPPLPVELTTFTAVISSDNLVEISWVTQTETGMVGYYIYRSTSETLDNAIAVSDMIEALNTAEQHTYKFIDSEIYDSGTYYYWLQTVEMGGTVSFYGPVSVYYTSAQDNPIPEIPKVTELRSIYPNPFNPVAYIPYSLAEESDAHFYIYNVKGQLLRHIYVGPKNPGYYQISWDGKDINGKACGSGVYYIIMKAGKQTFQRKAVLMK
ncbi:MAG TPA: choice-of-anchor D domain-containing protein, partial [Candidatus Syntrophosphaera thermopropionivorans]|nr:choice-of-anchor D domain-containing protein [Candidatus Syntrophosphaera thermopropionivorans]